MATRKPVVIGANGANTELAGGDLLPVSALPIGTTTGTVAAGDDSRITGALSASTAASTYAPIASPSFTGPVAAANSSANSTADFSISATSNGNGVNLRLVGNGNTTPIKTIRVIGGTLQVLNSAYTTALLSLDDGGNFTTTGAVTPGSPIALASGGTGGATAASARANLGVNVDGRRLAFDAGAVVTANSWSFDIGVAGTISNLLYEVGSAGGSFNVAVSIGGTVVTGLSAVAVSSATRASAPATGANTFAGTRTAPVRLTFTISNVVGQPTGSVLLLIWDKA